jgi:hypothetical protein
MFPIVFACLIAGSLVFGFLRSGYFFQVMLRCVCVCVSM